MNVSVKLRGRRTRKLDFNIFQVINWPFKETRKFKKKFVSRQPLNLEILGFQIIYRIKLSQSADHIIVI